MKSYTIGGQWLEDLNVDLSGSARSCAVLSGAILDDRTTVLLQTYLLAPDTQNDDKLLGRSGTVNTFSSRIELAYRLGLIAAPCRKALDWIRDIRNEAAHKSFFSFEDNSMTNRVQNIVEVLALSEVAPDLLQPPYDGVRGHFVASVIVLMSNIEVEIGETKRTAHIPIDAIRNTTFTG